MTPLPLIALAVTKPKLPTNAAQPKTTTIRNTLGRLLANRVAPDHPRQFPFYLLGLGAVLFHYSAILAFVPMLIIRQRTTTRKILTIAVLAAVAIAINPLAVSDELLGRYIGYFDLLAPDVSNPVSKTFVFGLPLYLMLYVSTVNRNNAIGLTALLLLWLFVRWLTSVYSLFGRIEMIVSAMLLFSIIEMSLNGRRDRLRKLAITGLSVMWLGSSLLGLAQEETIMSNLGVVDGIYSLSPFVPYRFQWEEDAIAP